MAEMELVQAGTLTAQFGEYEDYWDVTPYSSL
jgi:hypothetical protein